MGLDWDLLSCRLRGVTGASGRMPEWPCHGLGYGPRATTVAGAGARRQVARYVRSQNCVRLVRGKSSVAEWVTRLISTCFGGVT